MFWKVGTYVVTALLGLVFAVYAILAGLMWWGDQHTRVPDTNEDPVYARSFEPHRIELINDGLLSLQKRIELIENAQKTIELEFFIYELDTSARIVTSKLVQAAQRGVRVKLLVDFSAPVFKLGPQYAQLLEKNGVEVRYYNTASMLQIFNSQHRSHRKLLIADGMKAITGGRNIGNDYFNLSPTYNFLDSDVIVEGPVVGAIRKSFDHYWQSPLASRASQIKNTDENFDKNFHKADREITDLSKKIRAATAQRNQSVRQHICKDTVFVTDYSGTFTYNRQVFKRLVEFLQEARSELVGESPYFVLRRDGINLLGDLTKRGVKQTYLTNSLASTDAWYTVSALSLSLGNLRREKIDLRVYKGLRPDQGVLSVDEPSKRWGIHAKRAVVDRKHIVIGTYNVDPRSANFNSELMIICRDNPALAEEMRADLESRLAGSRPLFEPSGRALASLLQGSENGQRLRFALALPLVYLFDFLL